MSNWPFERAGTVRQTQTFIVKGSLPFPIDMLRRDACYPSSESDSNLITASIAHETRGEIRIEVRARAPLTTERWKSFGWEVVGIKSSD